MRLAVVLAVTSAFALTLAACLISTDGLSGGTLDAGALDGAMGTPTNEGGVTTQSDGAAPNDAGATADAATGPFFTSSGNAGWCRGVTPAARTCIDFDEADDLTGFDVHTTQGTATVDTVATSQPHELDTTVVANQTGWGYLQLDFATNPTFVRIQSDVRFETPSDYAEFDTVQFAYADGDCQLEPSVHDSQIVINEYCSQGQTVTVSASHPVTSLLPGAPGWYTLVVAIDLDARTFDATVKKPDGTVDGFPAPLTLNDKILTGAARWLLGTAFSQPFDPPSHIRFDNAVLDFK